MLFLTRPPAPPLDRFIENLWYCADYRPGHARERGLPGGTMEIVIALAHDFIPHFPSNGQTHAERWSHSLIAGPQAEYMVIDTSSLIAMAGIHFRPGGAVPFFGAPADAFANEHVVLDDVWGRAGGRMRERLLEAPTPEEKLSVMEAELRALLKRNPARDAAVEDAVARFDLTEAPTVAEAAARANLSTKRFTERFRREVGLTPATYRRIRRFRRAVHEIASGRAESFTSLALDCGYYDHAHFDHDFQAFAGVSPLVYFRNQGRSAWKEHLVIAD